MAPTSPHVIWDEGEGLQSDVLLDCLLPTGVLIQLHTRKNGVLADIKQELWLASQNYPLYSLLKDKNTYNFMCINQRAEKEELLDEAKRLCDVKPFQPMLKVVEKKGDMAEIILNFQISSIIGKGLKEFDALKNPEVSDFRVRMKQMCLHIAKERDAKDWLERAKYLYPPDVANVPWVPKHIEKRLSAGVINLVIQIGKTGEKFPLQVPMRAMLVELMDLFHKTATIAGYLKNDNKQYVLKVVGREEYLIGDYPLTQFNTIQSNLSKGKETHLSLVEHETLFVNERPKIPPRPNAPPPPKRPRAKLKGTCLWDLKDTYSICANMATNISFSSNAKVYLRAGIYHGPDVICGSNRSKEVLLTDQCAVWDEVLSFDIQLLNLPRMARLCLALFAVNDKRFNKKDNTTPRKVRKGKVDVVPLAWVNIPVFDYVDVLRTGCLQLYMWPINDEEVLSEELLNPRGSVECNPIAEEAIGLTLTCHDYNITGPTYYPGLERTRSWGYEAE